MMQCGVVVAVVASEIIIVFKGKSAVVGGLKKRLDDDHDNVHVSTFSYIHLGWYHCIHLGWYH